jgi:hypothetical protein
MFGRLNRDEEMPGIEQSVIPAATGESPADGDFLYKADLARVPLRQRHGESAQGVAVTVITVPGSGIRCGLPRQVYSGSHEIPDPGIPHQFSSSSP